MSFDQYESSRTLGQPLELYQFQNGNTFYRYCDGEDDYIYMGNVFAAVPIKHSPINSGGTLDRTTLDVTLADTTPLAALMRGYPGSSVTMLTLRQGHPSDPDNNFLVAWSGRVLSAARGEPGERVLSCQAVTVSLKRSGLRRNWQLPCPHVLYGDRCRASMTAASVTVTPVGVNRNTVALPAGWNAKPAAKYAGGLASWGGEVRTILRADDVSITLGGPASFGPGTVLTLSLGCNHLMDDCRGIHVPSDEADYGGGNIRNFGGQPFIPQKNPIGFVSNY